MDGRIAHRPLGGAALANLSCAKEKCANETRAHRAAAAPGHAAAGARRAHAPDIVHATKVPVSFYQEPSLKYSLAR